MPIAPPVDAYWPSSLFEDGDATCTSRVSPPTESLSSEAFSSEEVQTWSALHVRPRREKVVARTLKKIKNIGYFLPFSEQTRKYQRRKVRVQNLLFPGYVFVRGEQEEVQRQVIGLNGVVKCLEDPDQASLHSSLQALKAMLDYDEPVTAEQRLEPGQKVEITSGPLAGYRGQVIANKKALRFVIQLDFIQQGASVAVDSSMVKAL